jgi:hypothetical protein
MCILSVIYNYGLCTILGIKAVITDSLHFKKFRINEITNTE